MPFFGAHAIPKWVSQHSPKEDQQTNKKTKTILASEHWKELIWALITIHCLGFGLRRLLMTTEQWKDSLKGSISAKE